MSEYGATAPGEDEDDLWYVQLDSGEVRAWSLDQLDAAFKADLVNEQTQVRQDGTTTWSTLGELLGGGEEEPLPAPPPVPVFVSVNPLAPPIVHAAPAAARPAEWDGPHSRSLRPVVSEVDEFELSPVQFRSKKRGVAIAIAAVAVVGGLAFAATRFGGASASAPPPTAAANVAAAVAPPPPPPVDPVPVATPPAADPGARNVPLTDQQKRALAEVDKNREAARKARKAAQPHFAPKPAGTPFHKGGSKYDPLNAKL